MNLAGIVPAKGTSERVTSKNLQEVRGVPLFLWAANNLSRVLPLERIYVDSDSAEIRNLASAHGFQTIERPPDLATNRTDGNQLLLWAASQVEADAYLQHFPPTIFLGEATIRQAIEKLDEGYDSVFTVRQMRLYLWDENVPRYDLAHIPNSVTLPRITAEGMGFYATKRKTLLDNQCRVNGKHAMIELAPIEGIDIDYDEDLEFARAIARGLPMDSPYLQGLERFFPKGGVRLLALDVDGVMTDALVTYDTPGMHQRTFNARDGVGIKRARSKGVEVRILSAATAPDIVRERARVLGVEHLYVGSRPKEAVLDEWIEELGIGLADVAFIGDDLPDLALAGRIGCFACPADAVEEIKLRADVVLRSRGGDGCVREFVDEHLLGPAS